MGQKKGLYGQGTFCETASGRVRYLFSYYDEFDVRKRTSVTEDTEAECLQRADEFKQRIEQIKRGVPLNATICSILKQKVESDYKKNYCGDCAYMRNLATIDIIEKHPVGTMMIVDIKEYHMDSFLQTITKYSEKTIGKIYYMLRTAFRIAYDKKAITHNIMLNSSMKCPKSDKPQKKVKGLTEDDQKEFVKALEEYRPNTGATEYKLQLLIELYGGFRMGEINALRPEDINFKKGFVHVSRTISMDINNKPFLKDSPKTAAGVRDVPISKKLKPVLLQAINQMRDNPEGLIFYNYNRNCVVSTASVAEYYKRVCERYNIKGGSQHVLRHTFATRCIEAGIDALVLKTWLGHTDIHITLDTYSDVFDRMNLSAVSKFDAHIEKLMSDNADNE